MKNVIREFSLEIDKHGRLIHMDQQGLALLGYTHADLAAGCSLADLISGGDQHCFGAKADHMLEGERLGLAHYIFMSKSGTGYPALLTSRPKAQRDGLCYTVYLLPPSSPLTERIYENQKIFQCIIDFIDCGLCIIDPKGRISFWNPAAETITGLKRWEVIGKSCNEIFNCPNFKTMCPLSMGQKGISGPISTDIAINSKGRSIHLQKTSNYICTADGNITGAIESFVDLTPRDNAEAALNEARELVESARRAKRHFMANMNHEIRTPINGILGLLNLILTEETTPSQREYISSARRSAHILLELIEDILDFTIIDKGALNIELTGFSLNSVITSVITRQCDLIQNREVCIYSHVDDDVPDNILGDSGRLYQILKHLVGNGIKFTPTGEVVVRVARVPSPEIDSDDDTRRLMLHFSISDTGVGIPRNKLEMIFEAMSQVDDSFTRSVGGLGIGLTTVHRLINLLEGRIWMESDPGKGTTVHFILPFKKASSGYTNLEQIDSHKAKSGCKSEDCAATGAHQKHNTFIGPENRNLLLAPSALSQDWHLKFKQLTTLLETDAQQAERVLTQLKEEAKRTNQQTIERLLLRLLLAHRREDENSINHFYAILKRKLRSTGPVDDGPGS